MYLLRDDILEIVRILDQGGILCYPTDTIWAIGCDATNAAAIERLNALKGAAPNKGYIVLMDSVAMLKEYLHKMHPRIETLLAYHQRPLTLIYNNPKNLAEAVLGPDGSAAIRVAQDDFCKYMIGRFGKPVVSTAAAKIGMPFAPTFGAISSDILGGVDYVVKYRQDDKEPQQPSPIARMDRHQELDFIRE